MAKKIQVKQILELRAAGLSQNSIAKSRHMSKSSVSDVFQIAQECKAKIRSTALMDAALPSGWYPTK